MKSVAQVKALLLPLWLFQFFVANKEFEQRQIHIDAGHIDNVSTSPKSGLGKLCIGSNSDLGQWMLKAMEELLANVLHPKIQLLKHCLRAPDHHYRDH
ncbi:hypothetical protein MBANPS3_000443 [Mucor bainieri]